MDCYKELEIEETASIEEIKKSYKKLALRYHPDKNHDSGAADKFKNISEAYQILSDPEKRVIYDTKTSNIGQGSGPSDDHTSQSPYKYDPDFEYFTFLAPEAIFKEFFKNEEAILRDFFSDSRSGFGLKLRGTGISRDPFESMMPFGFNNMMSSNFDSIMHSNLNDTMLSHFNKMHSNSYNENMFNMPSKGNTFGYGHSESEPTSASTRNEKMSTIKNVDNKVKDNSVSFLLPDSNNSRLIEDEDGAGNSAALKKKGFFRSLFAKLRR